MPVNRNALIRYRTIDNCLRNRYRQWTLEDLIDACSEALYEFEGIDKGVSRRTVQMDIQMMRSEKLGYNAPIVVVDKKFYTYEDPDYSITNIPLTDQDLNKLTEVVDILRQFKGFTHFQDLTGMVQRLEDKIHTSKTQERRIIDLEKNDQLQGLGFIDPLYHAVLHKQTQLIVYQSFRAREASQFHFYPQLLKEYRNRWFVLGKREMEERFVLLALDRIKSLSPSPLPYQSEQDEVISNYFQDALGVTVQQAQDPVDVQLFIERKNAPYVLTKPMHHSQQVLEATAEGIVVSIRVHHNFELEREILGYGETVKVIAPAYLRHRIQQRLTYAANVYDAELEGNVLRRMQKGFSQRGAYALPNVFRKREIVHIAREIRRLMKREGVESGHLDLETHTSLFQHLFPKNLRRIIRLIQPEAKVIRIQYQQPPKQYPHWIQGIGVRLQFQLEREGFSHWRPVEDHWEVLPDEEHLRQMCSICIPVHEKENALLRRSFFPGSHQAKLQSDQISLIQENGLPNQQEIPIGGVFLFHPLLIRQRQEDQVAFIQIDLAGKDIQNSLPWVHQIEG
ncbi:MAG: WYL domain-containing protein [Bacteroidota bacterium]